MNVHVVIEIDGDSHEHIEAIFSKKKDADAYLQLLFEISRISDDDYCVREMPLDAAHTIPGVVGFSAYARDGDHPHVSGPIILGRVDVKSLSGRYAGGTMKGVRYASAEAATYEQAVANAQVALKAVGKPAAKHKAKKK